MPRPVISNPISLRVMPCSFCRVSAARPMNSPLSSLTIQAKPGLERRDGRMDLVAIERHARFQAQCVARAQAARFDTEFLAGV